MNPHTIKRLFPNASKATMAANVGDYGKAEKQFDSALSKSEPLQKYVEELAKPNKTRKVMHLRIQGQVRGGKNGMGVTRTGRHYAKPLFRAWRDDATRQVQDQLPAGWKPVTEPLNIRLDYYAGDKRRRDMPAVLDAVWHVLERAGLVADDTLLWAAESARHLDKSQPRVEITLLQKKI